MTKLTDEQQAILDRAKAYASANKKKIAKRFACKDRFPPEEVNGAPPVSLFMAGAPGAGKTETSTALLRFFETQGSHPVLRIDPDEFRDIFDEYNGENSWLFQPAVSILVEKVVDLALKQRQSFILDGTFSHLDKAKSNINRCLGRNRGVAVFYIYQDPLLAWHFASVREREEGRKIPLDAFVSQYFESRRVVNEIIREFGELVYVTIVGKNKVGDISLVEEVVDSIDTLIPETYDPQTLRNALLLSPEHKGG